MRFFYVLLKIQKESINHVLRIMLVKVDIPILLTCLRILVENMTHFVPPKNFNEEYFSHLETYHVSNMNKSLIDDLIIQTVHLIFKLRFRAWEDARFVDVLSKVSCQKLKTLSRSLEVKGTIVALPEPLDFAIL